MSSSISATTIKVGNALITAVNTAINLPPNSEVNGVPIQGIMSTITENSAGGSLALYLNTTGDYNTAIGANAGKISNGDNNTILVHPQELLELVIETHWSEYWLGQLEMVVTTLRLDTNPF